jgi:hypothetical protein
MHLLVPFASDTSEACRHVLRDLALPNLARLLSLLTITRRDVGEGSSLSPPHERALAAAWGWHGDDGCLPFAAQAASGDGAAIGNLAWGLITPVHWQLGRDHVLMTDPAHLELADVESRELFAALRPLFESEGFTVAFGAPARWYVGRADLDGVATASLDRVIGRSVDTWLRRDATAVARLLRRLQSEAQLLLHVHAINEAREDRAAPVVNSIWLSGCGRQQPADATATPQTTDALRAPLLAGDWAAWAEAWQALDAGAIASLLADAERGQAVFLTLCGERSVLRFDLQTQSLLKRLRARWQRMEPHTVLEDL